MNKLKVLINVPSEAILKRLNSTPTFSRLSRINLKVGQNKETVNHKQFSDMLRLYQLLGVTVHKD